jgi:hypothetical protein
MQIFLQHMTGKTVTIDASLSDTILVIKEKFHDKEGVLPAQQCLLFAGHELENNKTLSDYNIQKETTLNVVERALAVPAPPLEAVAAASTSEIVAVFARIAASVSAEPPTITISKVALIAAYKSRREAHPDQHLGDEAASAFGAALKAFGERDEVKGVAVASDGSQKDKADEKDASDTSSDDDDDVTSFSLSVSAESSKEDENNRPVEMELAVVHRQGEGKETDLDGLAVDVNKRVDGKEDFNVENPLRSSASFTGRASLPRKKSAKEEQLASKEEAQEALHHFEEELKKDNKSPVVAVCGPQGLMVLVASIALISVPLLLVGELGYRIRQESANNKAKTCTVAYAGKRGKGGGGGGGGRKRVFRACVG